MNEPRSARPPFRSGTAFLRAEDISKSFTVGRQRIEVLKGIGLTVERGEWVALLGASGSGKTTLLDILGTISRPDAGTLSIDGRDLTGESRRELTLFRRRHIGMVFQAYHLLPELNIRENVMLPALLGRRGEKESRARAEALLDRVGLAHRVNHRPTELSGGEQQRAAIARALINSPELLLADEPTGNLDSVTGSGIMKLFQELHGEGMTVVMVTHDRTVAGLATRTALLKDGFLS